MYPRQWTPGKSNFLLAALALTLWWVGLCLLSHKTETVLDSTLSQGLLTGHGLRIVPVKPTQSEQSQACGTLNNFFLRLNRKPRPDNTPVFAAITANLYQFKDSELILSLHIEQQRFLDQRKVFLRHCILLI